MSTQIYRIFSSTEFNLIFFDWCVFLWRIDPLEHFSIPHLLSHSGRTFSPQNLAPSHIFYKNVFFLNTSYTENPLNYGRIQIQSSCPPLFLGTFFSLFSRFTGSLCFEWKIPNFQHDHFSSSWITFLNGWLTSEFL